MVHVLTYCVRFENTIITKIITRFICLPIDPVINSSRKCRLKCLFTNTIQPREDLYESLHLYSISA